MGYQTGLLSQSYTGSSAYEGEMPLLWLVWKIISRETYKKC